MIVTWIMGLPIFVDGYLNIMTLSTCMKKLTGQHRVPREALSYIIDSAGAPVCAILPLSSWAIFFSGLFFTQPGIAELGYGTAIKTFYHVIPFAFYAIAAVAIVPLFIVGAVPKLGRMRTAYRRLQETGKVYSPESAPLNEEDESEFQTQGSLMDFILPVDVLIILAIISGTFGNRLAADFFPVEGASRTDLIRCAALTSLHDETPEGKSTLELACRFGDNSQETEGSTFLEFTAQTRMSGVDLPDGTHARKGASDVIEQYVKAQGGKVPGDLHTHVEKVSSLGGTPLVVCENNKALGVIYLKDTVKPGMVERFERLRAIGIKTIMCIGDNPLTADTIAKEAGVDGFIAE